MARPRELTQELLDKAESYLMSYQTVIPSRAGLALFINVARSTIYEWESKKDAINVEFSDILSKLDEMQEQVLINSGLSGDFNSTITKLMLTKHGYSDKTQQELSGPNGGELTIQLVRFSDSNSAA